MKIFISYSSANVDLARSLYESLKDRGFSPFLACDSLKPGEHFVERINKEIESCEVFVLLWSKHARESDWVIHELGKVRSNVLVIPVCFDSKTQLPIFIRDLQYIDAKDNVHEGMQKAVIRIEEARAEKIYKLHLQNSRRLVLKRQETNGHQAKLAIGVISLVLLAAAAE